MKTAKVKFVQGLQFVGMGDSGHAIVMDGSPKYGGLNSGPSPMELLLMGLGGCTGMDVAHVLRKKKQPFEGIEVNLKGEMAEQDPMRYTDVEIEYVVTGKGVDETAVERAIKLSMDKYCPVKGTFEGSTNIGWSFKVVEE
jgi:putative redox protein